MGPKQNITEETAVPVGLDHAFLHFIGVQSQVQRFIQEPYLAYFANAHRVVDLGCGQGDFVALLTEQGHDALGVDSDPTVVAEAEAQGCNVVCMDVFSWLAGEVAAVEAGDHAPWDGFFSAHLVEHLPFALVLKLCQQAARLLRPGGIIVLATPNVAAIHAHLDGYYRHFGHVTFYHPELLRFFLQTAGFERAETGENERVPSTLFFPVIRELNEHQVELDRIEAVSAENLPRHTDLAERSSRMHSRFAALYEQFSQLHDQLAQTHGSLVNAVGQDADGMAELSVLHATLQAIHGDVSRLAMEPTTTTFAGEKTENETLFVQLQTLHGRLNQLNSQSSTLPALDFSSLHTRLQVAHGQLGQAQTNLTHGGWMARLRRWVARLCMGGYADAMEHTLTESRQVVDSLAQLNAHVATMVGALAEERSVVDQGQQALAELTALLAQLNVQTATLQEQSAQSETSGRNLAHQLQNLTDSTAHINHLLAQTGAEAQGSRQALQQTVDLIAQLNQQMADLAELWVASQQMSDEMDDLLARQGTLVRDTARTNRRMESGVRTLIDQIDAPFEAYVVAWTPSGAGTERHE